MDTRRNLIVLAAVLAFLATLPVARASEQDQASQLTFNKDVQIPGRVLPAGTYWFVLAETTTRNVVQIFNSDRSTLYATIQTINAERSNLTGNTAVTFAGGAMQPESILTWFYPGFSSGHQFVYSNSEKKELAQLKQHTVIASAQDQHQNKPMVVGD